MRRPSKHLDDQESPARLRKVLYLRRRLRAARAGRGGQEQPSAGGGRAKGDPAPGPPSSSLRALFCRRRNALQPVEDLIEAIRRERAALFLPFGAAIGPRPMPVSYLVSYSTSLSIRVPPRAGPCRPLRSGRVPPTRWAALPVARELHEVRRSRWRAGGRAGGRVYGHGLGGVSSKDTRPIIMIVTVPRAGPNGAHWKLLGHRLAS